MEAVLDFLNLMQRFRELKVFEFPRMDLDLTISQLRIIGFVHSKDECRTQDIADASASFFMLTSKKESEFQIINVTPGV